MSCSNNDKTYQEDDYLIILHKDECSNDREFEEAIKLNLGSYYYIYQRTEFIDDSENYHRFPSQILLKRINLLKTYIKTSNLNIPLNLNRLKEMINEFLSLDVDFLQKIGSINKEIENLKIFITSNFENNIKKFGPNIEYKKKIQKSIDFIYWLLKKKTDFHCSESETEEFFNLNKVKSESKVNDGFKGSSQIESEVSFEQKIHDISSNNKIIELAASKKTQDYQGNTSPDKEMNHFDLNDNSSLRSAIGGEQIMNGTENDSSDNSNIDDVDSDISQKSEPIINKNRMHKLYRRAGTVINGNNSSIISDAKLDKDKYLKLIESYKGLTKSTEIKENISANQT
ncbi:hypothetical protein [Cryptosporidium parvum Iowa II]|uniref:Uncharacterized protein n=2 Tax=Cryptosporidium parvum TaxID=5807 RepID=Q5CVU5_CRYPI|nr:hypothetical protein [Cryptosporidium parvum Iowa II]EAK89459.1 hypothetical protein cgd8_2740 [Cryptosporidium parvum Iowa II]QOY40031.1 Uncharacterized protein CPATCC_0002860 [Cryptosporidium parvum]WKS79528.1 hypothetical protein CPCDC_8g2740 [Cryptosporidium sp. 43IA8]WRK34029.1 Uncharacterized protein cpbgf_8002740 [Cryptosporidium parvum]|eukprot:QOY40031.1 hypothetical protein CPATCC_004100 [Cryptosporidium parvum]